MSSVRRIYFLYTHVLCVYVCILSVSFENLCGVCLVRSFACANVIGSSPASPCTGIASLHASASKNSCREGGKEEGGVNTSQHVRVRGRMRDCTCVPIMLTHIQTRTHNSYNTHTHTHTHIHTYTFPVHTHIPTTYTHTWNEPVPRGQRLPRITFSATPKHLSGIE